MGYETLDGKLDPNEGVLYKLTKANISNPTIAISPVNISNGMAWNKNNTKFYYIDSPSRSIYQYDFDAKNGNISNKKIIFYFHTYNISGVPDGMTIDKNDNLWVAANGDGSVINVRNNFDC